MRRVLRFALILLAALVHAAKPDPTVQVTTGSLRGNSLSEGGAVFRGIPFAQAPVGELRWKPPVPVNAWGGVRDAMDFGPPCAQNAGGHILENSGEDCLFLNVWTSEWPPRTSKPVMFWIHGGGNYAGTASTASFDGSSLARRGVVVVTSNYRLTIFGFFAHSDLTGESPHHASGNYGLMDQIAALKWLRENIRQFGGDPTNVTVFGQSAGAVDANALMTSPLARGLFRRVIAESGTVTRNPDAATLAMTALGSVMTVKNGPPTYSDAPELVEAEKNGQALIGESIQAARAMSAADLLKAVAGPQRSIGPANGVIVDGWVLPRAPVEIFAKKEQQPIPLMIGSNSRERTPPDTTADEIDRAMKAMYGPLASRALALYPLAAPFDPLYGGRAAQWVVDTMYRCPVVAEALWHVAAGNPTYEYQFDHTPPGREGLGAVHGAEIPYVFGRAVGQQRPAEREISDALQRYWTNFAKTGDPNGTALPQWPRFDASRRSYIEFTDNGPVAHEGLRRSYCDLYVENVRRLMAQ